MAIYNELTLEYTPVSPCFGDDKMATSKIGKRPARTPKEPTPEQVKAVARFILATNEPALRALAHR